MSKRTVSGIMFVMLLVGMLVLAFDIQLAKTKPEFPIIVGTSFDRGQKGE